MTDDTHELVRRCLLGQEAAIREFVEQFQQVVFAVCLRMLRHRQDAEDATQETLVRALRGLDGWDRERPLLPWLLTIATNRCRTALSQRVRRPVPSDALAETEDSDDRSPAAELGEELELALAALRPEYQHCFRLFYLQDRNCVDIGELMGVPEGTIKTWLHRARREMMDRLRRRGVSPESNHELPRTQKPARRS